MENQDEDGRRKTESLLLAEPRQQGDRRALLRRMGGEVVEVS